MTKTEAVPEEFPKQVTGCAEVNEFNGAKGCATLMVTCSVHPLESVTTTVYAPAGTPFNVSLVTFEPIQA
jgi:hypothetical protein